MPAHRDAGPELQTIGIDRFAAGSPHELADDIGTGGLRQG
jgi:hypothetical protein